MVTVVTSVMRVMVLMLVMPVMLSMVMVVMLVMQVLPMLPMIRVMVLIWLVAKFSWQPRVCGLKSPLFISFQPSALQFNWWPSLKSFTSSIDKPSFFLIVSEISFPVTALIIVNIFKACPPKIFSTR